MRGFLRSVHAATFLFGNVVTAHRAEQQPLQAQDLANARKPLVDSEELQSYIHGENLLARAEDLYKFAELSWHKYGHPTRVIGSAGHDATLNYIYATLAKLGDYYDVSAQAFPTFLGRISDFRLVVDGEILKNASAMGLTPGTKHNEPVHGDLVLVENNGCTSSDFPDAVEGNVALIRRGECSFGNKSSLAGRAGAVAAVIYNSENGTYGGTLGTPEADHVATFGLALAEAIPLLQRLDDGEQIACTAFLNATVRTVRTSNIIAQSTSGDPENCIMLGAHSDSVSAGPGINDDGSGTLSLLEVATHLARYRLNNCIRLAWWAAEEEGLIGSLAYTALLPPHENRKIRMFMDYDMMASPNFAYQIYAANNDDHPTGSAELRDLYVDWYTAHDLNYTFIPFDGRSDYLGFLLVGIPAGGIATGAEGIKKKNETALFGGRAGEWYDPCYHQLCDDVGNVNVTAWEINTRLIAHSVATYARSLEGFPERQEGEEEETVSAVGIGGGAVGSEKLMVCRQMEVGSDGGTESASSLHCRQDYSRGGLGAIVTA